MELGKKKGNEGPANSRLLQELEALSSALYTNRKPARLSGGQRSISAGKSYHHYVPENPKPRASKEKAAPSSSSLSKEKKPSSSSFWNWKPIRALSSNIRNRRFNCSFSLHVHSIESLPSDFHDLSLRVHWRRRDGGLETRPSRVFNGIAEFDEILSHNCSVYGTRNGPRHSAKYEAKHFLLYASLVGSPGVDFGRHRIDLTRLLPLTLEELEEEKSSGMWSTSFKLSGKAKGALLNVSFGFVVLRDDRKGSQASFPVPNVADKAKPLMGHARGDCQIAPIRLERPQVPTAPRAHLLSRSSNCSIALQGAVPTSPSEVTPSPPCEKLDFKPITVNFPSDQRQPYQNLPLEHSRESYGHGDEDAIFSVVDKGIEIAVAAEQETEVCVKIPSEADTFRCNEVCLAAQVSAGDPVKYCQLLSAKEKLSAPMENTSSVLTPLNEHLESDKHVVVGTQEVTLSDIKIEVDGEASSAGASTPDQDGRSNLPVKDSAGEVLASAIQNPSVFDVSLLDYSPNEFSKETGSTSVKSNYKAGKMGKSLSLEEFTESVTSEFLDMLGQEHSPSGLSSDSDTDSPRGHLWRQFRRESLATGGGVFGIDFAKELESDSSEGSHIQFDPGERLEELDLSLIIDAAESEQQKADHAFKGKTRGKILEGLETEMLMREWGLNESVFQGSSSNNSHGFGSPIDFSPSDPYQLPPLGEGLGPFIQTRNGGFIRSMSPLLFRNAKNNANLVMQVSSPVVVPAEMGSGVMEILQCLASVGIEKLSMQASRLMPLEDITGKTVQQVAWEAMPYPEPNERQDLGHDVPAGEKRMKSMSISSSSFKRYVDSEYVSLEELAPLAMDKIEALSIEGLRIQSGMSDEEAPSNISPQSVRETSVLGGVRAKDNTLLGLEGAAGLQLLDLKHGTADVDGLMNLSLSLDEWMKLDAGIVDDDNQNNSRTSKILAAHHANVTAKDLISGHKRDERGKKGCKWGLLGNNFTVALMVQLRDPLRNYESIGTPMLALIQVERIFVPPKAKIKKTVFEKVDNEEVDVTESASVLTKEEKKDEQKIRTATQFKIVDVHVAGTRMERTEKKLWGSSTQQQSGSRWLLASGMGKGSKHPLMKSKVGARSFPAMATGQSGNMLWSISSCVHDNRPKWKELEKSHTRNPNILFPNRIGKFK